MTDHLKRLGVPLVFAAGVAWATAMFALRGKLDAQTYRDDRTQQAVVDSTILHELRTIRFLLCRQQPTDSYCGAQTP